MIDCWQGYGQPFPRDFGSIVRTILKRLFRVYGHIFHSHFRQIKRLELDDQLATCFRHFICFTQVPCTLSCMSWAADGGFAVQPLQIDLLMDLIKLRIHWSRMCPESDS